ncbi:MAG: hypothetical protein JNJ88_05350 [Planctomycetes bacterium]|nr:hypothetical protein [Planctomycetota bacterium]
MSLDDFLPFGLLIGFIAVGLFVQSRLRRRSRRAWEEAAAELGLQFECEEGGAKPRLRGELNGLSVSAYELEVRTQKSRSIVTRAEVLVPGLPADLRVARSDWTQLVQDALGIREVEVGDPEFDKRFRILGREDVARAVLDADARRSIDDLARGGTAWIAEGKVLVQLQGSVLRSHPFIERVRQLVFCAAAVSSACRSSPRK